MSRAAPDAATPSPGQSRPARLVEPGQTVRVGAAELARTGRLELGLVLPVPHEGDEPLPARLIPPGQPPIEAVGLLAGGDGRYARLELPAERLAPGTYLIELRVRERSPLPLRRYVLEIE